MTPSSNVISVRSVAAWGFLNLALLGIAAAGLPLWAHHPYPRESLAIYVLICGQMLLASMLFPLLTRTRWTLAINLAFLLPIDELGGLLSNLNQISILRCGLCVGVWLTGLGVWSFLVKSDRVKLAGVAAATCFTAGGAVLDYLRWESAALNIHSASFTPLSLLPGACNLVLHFNPIPWIESLSPMILVIITFIVMRFSKSSSNSLHNAPPI